MYNPVGIDGCEPPQPQQFSRKINASRVLITVSTRAITATRNQRCRPSPSPYARVRLAMTQWVFGPYGGEMKQFGVGATLRSVDALPKRKMPT
jgi:hypothetical protein